MWCNYYKKINVSYFTSKLKVTLEVFSDDQIYRANVCLKRSIICRPHYTTILTFYWPIISKVVYQIQSYWFIFKIIMHYNKFTNFYLYLCMQLVLTNILYVKHPFPIPGLLTNLQRLIMNYRKKCRFRATPCDNRIILHACITRTISGFRLIIK